VQQESLHLPHVLAAEAQSATALTQYGDTARQFSVQHSTAPFISFILKTQGENHTDTAKNIDSVNSDTRKLAVVKATEIGSNKQDS